jgi:hypothetical protein
MDMSDLIHRKRNAKEPDKAAGYAARCKAVAESDETVLQVSLSRLKFSKHMSKEIDNIVLLMSMLIHERSRLVWLHLDMVMKQEEGESQRTIEGFDLIDSNANFFRRCLTVGVRGARTHDADKLMSTIKAYPQVFGDLLLPSHCGNTITFAAKMMRTNFMNHFVLSDRVYCRAKKYVKALLFGRVLDTAEKEEDVDDGAGNAAGDIVQEVSQQEKADNKKPTRGQRIYRIIKWVFYSETCDEASCNVAVDDYLKDSSIAIHVRDVLRVPEGECVTENWLKKNVYASMRFARIVSIFLADLKEQPPGNGERLAKGVVRNFRWVPMHKAKAHHVLLDATTLASIFRTTGTIVDAGKPAYDEVTRLMRPSLESAFGNKHSAEFTGTISTDGLTACVHFRVRKSNEELAAIEARRDNRIKNEMEKQKDKEKYDKARLMDPTLPVKKPRAAVSKPELTIEQKQAAVQAKLSDTPEWLIATDPGRIQMSKTVVFHNGNLVFDGAAPRTFMYTSGQYYSEAGIDTRTKKMSLRRKQAGLTEVDDLASLGSTLGVDVNAMVKHAEAIRLKSDMIWKFALARKTRNAALRNIAGKRRALARHWIRVRRECGAPKGANVTHAYGSAKVSPNGRGNLSVPTSQHYRIAKQIFPETILADEWRTSQVCDVTNADMAQVIVCRTNLVDVLFEQDPAMSFTSTSPTPAQESLLLPHPTAMSWSILGHDHMSKEQQKERRAVEKLRRGGNMVIRVLRGLLTCATGNGKYRDRDTMAAINIGRVYLGDIRGEKRLPAFDRCIPHVPKRLRKARAIEKQTI